MLYLFPQIKEDGLSKFLLDQKTKTAYFDNVLIQKYPKSETVDDIICLIERHVCYDVVGFVDYAKGEIILCKDYVFSPEVRQQPEFINLYDLRNNLVSKMRKMIEEKKKAKLEELKLTERYTELYNKHKPRFIDTLVVDMLKNKDFEAPFSSYAQQKIETFVKRLKDGEVLAITGGETVSVDNQIEEIMKCREFMFTDVVVPILVEEAADMIKSGELSERLLIVKNYIEKTKALKDVCFTVETTDGTKFKCNNEVLGNGQVVSIKNKHGLYTADVADIVSVTYNKTCIYKKEIS